MEAFIILGIKKTKSRNTKSYKKNTLYVQNINWPMGFELFEQDERLAKEIFTAFCIVGVTLIMMVQICVSASPASAEELDKLSSLKLYKSKIINSREGLIVSACIGLTIAFPYSLAFMDESSASDLSQVAMTLVENFRTNVKRIKPSYKENVWLDFAMGEMGAAKGQLLSCPSSNSELLNIKGLEVNSFGIEDALNYTGFDKSLFLKYGVDVIKVREDIRNLLLQERGGFVGKLNFAESETIGSKIESELIGEAIVRSEKVSATLSRGNVPDLPMDKNFLEKYLTRWEVLAYNIAIRTGNVEASRSLAWKAIDKSKEDLKVVEENYDRE